MENRRRVLREPVAWRVKGFCHVEGESPPTEWRDCEVIDISERPDDTRRSHTAGVHEAKLRSARAGRPRVENTSLGVGQRRAANRWHRGRQVPSSDTLERFAAAHVVCNNAGVASPSEGRLTLTQRSDGSFVVDRTPAGTQQDLRQDEPPGHPTPPSLGDLSARAWTDSSRP